MAEVVVRAQKIFLIIMCRWYKLQNSGIWRAIISFSCYPISFSFSSIWNGGKGKKNFSNIFLSINMCLSCKSLMEDQTLRGHSCHFSTQMRCPLSCLGIGHLTLYVNVRSFLTALHPDLLCLTAVTHVWHTWSQGNCLAMFCFLGDRNLSRAVSSSLV